MNLATPESDYGTVSAPRTVRIQRRLPGPIDRVWAYLTESDLRRQWLAAGDMPPATGGMFELTWRNDELVHAGISDRRNQVMIGAGWHMHLDVMRARIAGTRPEPFWDGWLRLREDYEQRIPADA